MLCGETVAVCCENRTEHTDTVRTSQETQIHCAGPVATGYGAYSYEAVSSAAQNRYAVFQPPPPPSTQHGAVLQFRVGEPEDGPREIWG
jgi:hypothetical protein